jgi:hypothetical protein
MEFKQVVKASHNFALANGGTMATYPAGHEKFVVMSRTNRTEIVIERDPSQPGVWLAEQRQNAAGESNPAKELFTTENGLLQCLYGFWQVELDPQPSAPVFECPVSPVQ